MEGLRTGFATVEVEDEDEDGMEVGAEPIPVAVPAPAPSEASVRPTADRIGLIAGFFCPYCKLSANSEAKACRFTENRAISADCSCNCRVRTN